MYDIQKSPACSKDQQRPQESEQLILPSDYPRQQHTNNRYSYCHFTLTRVLSEQLKQLAGNEKQCLYSIMSGAFVLLLSRYSGQNDVTVGSVISNTFARQTTVGFSADSPALRAVINPQSSFRELVSHIHMTIMDMQQHQDAPGKHNLSLSSQVLFAFYPFAQPVSAIDANSVEFLNPPGRTMNRELALVIDDGNNPFTGWLSYCASLFLVSTIERLWQHYVQVLQQVVEKPDVQLRDISLLTEREQQKITIDWNQTDSEPVPGQEGLLLHQLFAQQAEQSPDDICLIFAGLQFSNQQINNRANQLALTIQKYIKERCNGELPPESCVVVCCEPGPDINIAAMAVLKAGCIYVPVNHNEAPERIRFILANTSASLVLTTSWQLWPLAEQPAIPVLPLDQLSWHNTEARPSESLLQPDACACITFTSGTTGKPKGVITTHKGLLSRIQSTLSRLPTLDGDVFIQRQPHAFDFSEWEIFWFMSTSCPTVIAPRNARHDPGLMCDLMAQHNVTIMMAVPSFLNTLCDFLMHHRRALPTSVRLLISAGESLTFNLATRLTQLSRHCDFMLYNAYGPTEVSLYATLYRFSGQSAPNGIIPIGKPLADTRLYVLGDHGQPQPVGVSGELYIGGAGVAKGYLNRPDLTELAFVSNTFASINDYRRGYHKLYRTGDRVQWRDDGQLLFMGRIDHQVKIRGYRVEPAEVERVMLTLDGVNQAIVLPRSRAPDNRQNNYDYLVAWYVGDRELNESELREKLADKLPQYMVPVACIPISHLPLTPNGKLDARALPEPGREETDNYVAATGVVETSLCQLWQAALPARRIGVHDNFFYCGGDSLLAVRLCQQISDELSVDVPVDLLFQYPTIAKLTPHLNRDVSPIAARRLERGPMSFAQQRLWFIEQYEQGTSAYHIPLLFQITCDADRDRLIQALQLLVIRHPALRTRFSLDDNGQRIQQVGNEALAVTRRRVSNSALDDALADTINAPFDLSQDHPLRVVLFLAGDRQVLLLLFHHISVDGWSMDTLRRELAVLYRAGNSTDAQDALPPLAIDYLDFTMWQRDNESRLNGQSQWWRQQLAGLEFLNLPLDYPRPHHFDYRGQHCHYQLTKTLSRQVRQLARNELTTLYTVMLSAFALLLSRYSRQDDLAVGSPIANRNHPQLEPLVGFFANTVVVRITLNPQLSFQELISRVRSTVTTIQQHQDIPFEQLVEQLSIERDPARSPLFQVMFAVQHFANSAQSFSTDTIHPLPLPDKAMVAKFDLSLIIDDDSEQLTGCLEYPVSLFQASTMQRLWQHYVLVLEQVVANPGKRLQDISLLTHSDYQQTVVHWNKTSIDLSQAQKNVLLHQLFEQRAQEFPNDVCLIYADLQLSNQEVNRRADQLALTIEKIIKQQHHGVIPVESCVVVCCEPGPEINIAALAVLKSGCVYVPVNHNEPLERIRFILRDTSARLVLTTSGSESLFKALDHEQDNDHQDSTDKNSRTVARLNLDQYHWSDQVIKPSPCTVTPEKLAYIIYTSGTTGTPKGVMLEHGAVTIRMLDNLKRFPANRQDVFLQRTAHGFDVSIIEMFWSMASLGRTVIADSAARRDPALLVRLLSAEQVSIALFTPSGLDPVCQELAANRRKWPTSLRLLICAGEGLPQRLITQTYQLGAASLRIANAYGPSETAVATVSVCRHSTPEILAPIGKPLINTQVYVLDNWGNPLPVNIPGELYIGGAGLARGYLNQPEMSSGRFVYKTLVTDSYPSEIRLYRTGDVVKWLACGELQFIARTDHQIKIHGFRVEPSEVERCLENIKGIRQAAVSPRSRPGPEMPATGRINSYDYLIAWFIADQPMTNTELRTQLSHKLPAYMIPVDFIQVDCFPVTANGKLDTRALPEPIVKNEQDYVAPTNATENRLCQLWQELLPVEQVGIHDNFFHCGGDSLLAITLCQLIKQKMSASLRVSDLFHHPTVSELARFMLGQKNDSPCADFAAEILVGDQIAPGTSLQPDSLNNAFLTGATGFLGSHLLYDLLNSQTNMNIYCLVRATNDHSAKQRLVQAMSGYGLWHPEFSARISVIRGDLTKDRLGIPPGQWSMLLDTINVIYHNGALVNASYDYKIFKAPNVQSVTGILQLASMGQSKYINFISTLGMYMSTHKHDHSTWLEDEAVSTSDISPLPGYTQSKWVAEQILERARSRGFHIAIHRPSRIVFNKKTLHYNNNDFLTRVLCFSLKKKLIPDAHTFFLDNVVNVDTVSRTITSLSLLPSSYGKNFNICNTQNMPFEKFFLALKQRHPEVKCIAADKYIDAIRQEKESTLRLVFEEENEARDSAQLNEAVIPPISSANTQNQLKVNATSWFNIKDAQIKSFIDSLCDRLL